MDKVQQISWQNYKGLPDGKLDLSNADSLILIGPNGTGKTSIMQIFASLAQEGESTDPLKHGEESGEYAIEVVKDGDNYVVTRRFNADGKDQRLVRKEGKAVKEDGKAITPNRKWFRSFFNAPTFDPFDLINSNQKDQIQMLFDIAGFDPGDYDKKIDVAYNKRYEVGVQRKTKKGALDEMGEMEVEEIERIDVAALLEEQRQAQDLFGKITVLKGKKAVLDSQIEQKAAAFNNKKREIARLQQEMELIKEEGLNLREEQSLMVANIGSLEANAPDLNGIQSQLAVTEDTNKKAADLERHKKLSAEFEELDGKWKELDSQVIELRNAKAKEISGLSFPDPNLFIESGYENDKWKYEVRYFINSSESVLFAHGHLNTAKLIEASLGLKLHQMAQKEQLPILRIDASALDDTSIDLVINNLRSRGVFGVLEKALGRQGVDTLQYKIIESKGAVEPLTLDDKRKLDAPHANGQDSVRGAPSVDDIVGDMFKDDIPF